MQVYSKFNLILFINSIYYRSVLPVAIAKIVQQSVTVVETLVVLVVIEWLVVEMVVEVILLVIFGVAVDAVGTRLGQ